MRENTKISYLYRDAANYKTFDEVIIKGRMEYKDFAPYLKDGEFFIPSEVELKDLHDNKFSNDDHFWHEIIDCETTLEQNTIDLDREKMLKLFQLASAKEWNEREVFKKKGLL